MRIIISLIALMGLAKCDKLDHLKYLPPDSRPASKETFDQGLAAPTTAYNSGSKTSPIFANNNFDGSTSVNQRPSPSIFNVGTQGAAQLQGSPFIPQVTTSTFNQPTYQYDAGGHKPSPKAFTYNQPSSPSTDFGQAIQKPTSQKYELKPSFIDNTYPTTVGNFNNFPSKTNSKQSTTSSYFGSSNQNSQIKTPSSFQLAKSPESLKNVYTPQPQTKHQSSFSENALNHQNSHNYGDTSFKPHQGTEGYSNTPNSPTSINQHTPSAHNQFDGPSHKYLSPITPGSSSQLSGRPAISTHHNSVSGVPSSKSSVGTSGSFSLNHPSQYQPASSSSTRYSAPQTISGAFGQSVIPSDNAKYVSQPIVDFKPSSYHQNKNSYSSETSFSNPVSDSIKPHATSSVGSNPISSYQQEGNVNQPHFGSKTHGFVSNSQNGVATKGSAYSSFEPKVSSNQYNTPSLDNIVPSSPKSSANVGQRGYSYPSPSSSDFNGISTVQNSVGKLPGSTNSIQTTYSRQNGLNLPSVQLQDIKQAPVGNYPSSFNTEQQNGHQFSNNKSPFNEVSGNKQHISQNRGDKPQTQPTTHTSAIPSFSSSGQHALSRYQFISSSPHSRAHSGGDQPSRYQTNSAPTTFSGTRPITKDVSSSGSERQNDSGHLFGQNQGNSPQFYQSSTLGGSISKPAATKSSSINGYQYNAPDKSDSITSPQKKDSFSYDKLSSKAYGSPNNVGEFGPMDVSSSGSERQYDSGHLSRQNQGNSPQVYQSSNLGGSISKPSATKSSSINGYQYNAPDKSDSITSPQKKESFSYDKPSSKAYGSPNNVGEFGPNVIRSHSGPVRTTGIQAQDENGGYLY